MTQVTRIPGGELEEYQSWKAPVLSDNNRVLPSAEKEDRLRREKHQKQTGEIVGEPVDAVPSGPITAEQLAEITETAHREGFEQGRAEGYQAGHTSGYAVGEQTALQETRARVEAQYKQLALVLDGLTNPFETQTQQLETILSKTITTLVATVVQRELQLDSSHIHRLIKQALDALPNCKDTITVFVNSADKLLLETTYSQQAGNWSLRADDQLHPGGCRIETKESLVDFSVEARLAEICDAFLRGELNQIEVDPVSDLKPNINSDLHRNADNKLEPN